MERVRLVGRRIFFRIVAPVAFLAAATIAVLLVRSGLRHHASATTSVPTVTTPTTTPTPRPQRRRFYRIQSGDTLDLVAIRFHTTVRRLLRLNPGIDPHSLRPGQTLRVR